MFSYSSLRCSCVFFFLFPLFFFVLFLSLLFLCFLVSPFIVRVFHALSLFSFLCHTCVLLISHALLVYSLAFHLIYSRISLLSRHRSPLFSHSTLRLPLVALPTPSVPHVGRVAPNRTKSDANTTDSVKDEGGLANLSQCPGTESMSQRSNVSFAILCNVLFTIMRCRYGLLPSYSVY